MMPEADAPDPAAASARRLLEAELGGPVTAASSGEMAEAVGRVVAGLPPDRLHRAVDVVAAAAPLMPDRETAEAVADAARRGISRVAAANPRQVERWWADLLKESVAMAAVASPRPGGTTAGVGAAGRDRPTYARDLVLIPERPSEAPAPAVPAIAFAPPKPPVRPAPPVRAQVRPEPPRASLSFAEAFRRDARGLLSALSDLLTRSIDGPPR